MGCGVRLYSKLFTKKLSLTILTALPCDLSRCIIGKNTSLISLTSAGNCLPIPTFIFFKSSAFLNAFSLTISLSFNNGT